MSQQPDEYPTFHDADVEIVSMTGKTWQLHSGILKRCSAIFKSELASHPINKLKRVEKASGIHIQWKFYMVKSPAMSRVGSYSMSFADFIWVNLRKEPPPSFILYNTSPASVHLEKIYDNIFRIFYNLAPDFAPGDETDDLAAPMQEAIKMLMAAGRLEAYPATRHIVESFLFSFNHVLWYQVENRPEVWASIACSLQSAPVFREAMLHLTGRWHLQKKDGVDVDLLKQVEWGYKILRLVQEKGKELRDYKLQAERLLCEFVPPRMCHEAKENVDGIVAAGKDVYSNDIYSWMSLHIVRQYITSAFLQNKHHRAHDGGISFYRTLANPDSYLPTTALKSFNTMFAMTPKSNALLFKAVDKIKEELAPIARQLLVNNSQAIKPENTIPYKYLTCTVVLDEELPWIEKEKEFVATTANHIPAQAEVIPTDDDNQANLAAALPTPSTSSIPSSQTTISYTSSQIDTPPPAPIIAPPTPSPSPPPVLPPSPKSPALRQRSSKRRVRAATKTKMGIKRTAGAASAMGTGGAVGKKRRVVKGG